MTFKYWDDKHWKATVRDEDHIELNVPGNTYVFNKHDFLELAHNINMIAENLFEKEEWFVHDSNIINRRTGEQLIGVNDDCLKLNELTEEINELKEDNQKRFKHMDNFFETLIQFSKRDLTDVERASFNCLCKELGVDLE